MNVDTLKAVGSGKLIQRLITLQLFLPPPALLPEVAVFDFGHPVHEA